MSPIESQRPITRNEMKRGRGSEFEDTASRVYEALSKGEVYEIIIVGGRPEVNRVLTGVRRELKKLDPNVSCSSTRHNCADGKTYLYFLVSE